MQDVLIERLAALFCRELEHCTLPGEARKENEVRLVLGFWDYDELRVKRDAGIAWVRRQWQQQVEPTVILGFESRESILRGEEASLFENGTIVYIQLPVSLTEIQAAVDCVLRLELSELDPESLRRNSSDYWRRLYSWHHSFKGAVMANILAVGERLTPGQPDRVRRLEYKVLAGYREDLVKDRLEGGGDREGLASLCEDGFIDGYSSLGKRLWHARSTLKKSVKIWENTYEMLQQGYTDERANTVCMRLGELRNMFEEIDKNVLEVLVVVKRLTGEEAADGQ